MRKAASLPVAETGPAEWLLLKIGGKDVVAMPVLKRVGGHMLGISLGALTPAQLEANSVTGVFSRVTRDCSRMDGAYHVGNH